MGGLFWANLWAVALHGVTKDHILPKEGRDSEMHFLVIEHCKFEKTFFLTSL